MARKLTKTVKSINTAIVGDGNKGTHPTGFVFGDRGLVRSGTITNTLSVVKNTADVTEAWSMTLVVPELFRFKSLYSVTTAAGGALNTADYSTSNGPDGNTIVNIVADARDGGATGTDPIANGEDVTVVWDAYDETTWHATMFSVKVQSDNSGHATVVKVRFPEEGDLHTFTMFPGDSLRGPFSEVEIDSFANAASTAFVYYQEH